MTKSIDEWAATKCGVELRQIRCGDESRAHMFKFDGKTYWFKWTIKDPRCREIFRTWWLLQNKARKVNFHFHGVSYIEAWDNGFTWNSIKEEDCITAIYEAENIQRDI